MTMTIADEKIQVAAETFRRVGLRKLQDPYRAGMPLDSDEVFAVLFQPELADIAAQLEAKHGGALFAEARDGRSRDLGIALAADRMDIASAALRVGR